MLPRLVALAFLACSLAVWAGCDTTDAADDRQVFFEVTGDASRAFVVQRIGDFTNTGTFTLPWGTGFPVQPGVELELGAQSTEPGEFIRVQIYIDGEVAESIESVDGSEVGINLTVPSD